MHVTLLILTTTTETTNKQMAGRFEQIPVIRGGACFAGATALVRLPAKHKCNQSAKCLLQLLQELLSVWIVSLSIQQRSIEQFNAPIKSLAFHDKSLTWEAADRFQRPELSKVGLSLTISTH